MTKTTRCLNIILLCCLLSSGIAYAQGAPIERKSPDRSSLPERALLIGVLTEQGDMQCNERGAVSWVNKHLEVGFTPLVIGPDKALMETLRTQLGALVAVEGVPITDYARPPVTHQGPCMVPQMRSDWRQGMHGMRVQRYPNPFPALKTHAVKAFDALKVARQGDELHITLRNVLDRPLEALHLSLHYEGCYGKPGSNLRQKTIPRIEPGAEISVSWPAIISSDSARGSHRYAANSITLRSSNPTVFFDLNRHLSAVLGKDKRVECPRD